MIVDDEPYIAEILKELLEDLNFDIQTAGNGQEAYDLLSVYPTDIVICDIKMPKMTGLDCLMNCQKKGIISPFIFITGEGDNKLILQALRLGAVDFIHKPFNEDEVKSVVIKAIDIGFRQKKIQTDLAQSSEDGLKAFLQQQKMISLLRVSNHLKKTA